MIYYIGTFEKNSNFLLYSAVMYYYYCIPPLATRSGQQGPMSPQEKGILATVGNEPARLHHQQHDIR